MAADGKEVSLVDIFSAFAVSSLPILVWRVIWGTSQPSSQLLVSLDPFSFPRTRKHLIQGGKGLRDCHHGREPDFVGVLRAVKKRLVRGWQRSQRASCSFEDALNISVQLPGFSSTAYELIRIVSKWIRARYKLGWRRTLPIQ